MEIPWTRIDTRNRADMDAYKEFWFGSVKYMLFRQVFVGSGVTSYWIDWEDEDLEPYEAGPDEINTGNSQIKLPMNPLDKIVYWRHRVGTVHYDGINDPAIPEWMPGLILYALDEVGLD